MISNMEEVWLCLTFGQVLWSNSAHLTAVAHHCLKTMLRVQIPPFYKAVLRAGVKEGNNTSNLRCLWKCIKHLRNSLSFFFPSKFWPCNKHAITLDLKLLQKLKKISLTDLVTSKFFFFKSKACVMASLCPFSLYKPHSFIMSQTITSVSYRNKQTNK